MSPLRKGQEKSSRDHESLREDLKGFMKMMLKEIKSKEVSSTERGRYMENRGLLPTPSVNKDQGSLGTTAMNTVNTEMLTKIELIAFKGKEPRSWLRKCFKYFEVYKVPMD